MSERIYAFLLNLYPARFREGYKEEAIQLYRDLSRHETGPLRRTRLWMRLLVDLAVGLPQAYRNTYVSSASSSFAQAAEGSSMFRLLEGQSVRPESFLFGSALTLTILGVLSALLSHPTVYRAGKLSNGSRSPIESVLERLNQPAPSGLSGSDSQQADASPPGEDRSIEAKENTVAVPQQALTPAQNRIGPAERHRITESAATKSEPNPPYHQPQPEGASETMVTSATQGTQSEVDNSIVAVAYSTPNPQFEPQVPLMLIQRATIIAFGPPTARAGRIDGNASESLTEFQLYTQRIEQPLNQAGIAVHFVHARTFRIRLGAETTEFHPKTDFGYYLIAPGKKPLVEYGVMTDSDLLLTAKQYFDPVATHNQRLD